MLSCFVVTFTEILHCLELTLGRRQSKNVNERDEHRSKIVKTEFSIAICRQTGDKWRSKMLFLAIFGVFDCRLSGVELQMDL